MTPVNVVFMGNILYPEGLAETKRFQHFIDGVMVGAGNTASVLLLRQSHPGRDESRLAGEHRGVHFATIGHDISAGVRLPFSILRYLAAGFARLRRARRAGARNVLFLYNEPNFESLLFVVWARVLGYQVVVDIVEDAYFVPAGSPLISRMKAQTARWSTEHLAWFADGIVVISTYLQRKLEQLAPGLPVELIPISVDLGRVAPSGAPFHQPVRMLYAGNFGDKDDIEGLLGAFEQVAAREPALELLLTGKAVATRMAEVRERIARSAVAARIRYLGFLPDQEYFALIRDCDIACVVRMGTEFADRGFPFKLGEYLATGRPVIASRVSDVASYLTDRVEAMLVAPGARHEIVAAIDWLLADEQRALALGGAGRRVAEAHFNAARNGRKLLLLIDRAAPP